MLQVILIHFSDKHAHPKNCYRYLKSHINVRKKCNYFLKIYFYVYDHLMTRGHKGKSFYMQVQRK